MSRSTSFFLLLITLASCKQHELSFTELQKRDWDSLDKGVYYISRQHQSGTPTGRDSIELNLKGVSGKEISSLEIALEDIPAFLKESLIALVKNRLRDSRTGYLKVNPNKMFMRQLLKATIVLIGDYSGPGFGPDSAALVTIPGIQSAKFISKEEGKKKYLADGNQDWENILDDNPLPNTIEVSLQEKNWTDESMKQLESEILQKLAYASQLSYSGLITKKSESYLYFSYEWK
jgi:hypothetical protein